MSFHEYNEDVRGHRVSLFDASRRLKKFSLRPNNQNGERVGSDARHDEFGEMSGEIKVG